MHYLLNMELISKICRTYKKIPPITLFKFDVYVVNETTYDHITVHKLNIGLCKTLSQHVFKYTYINIHTRTHSYM